MAQDHLVVHGAREHNLKDITVRLPRNKLVCITGLSGSGKSSLAFDTIYAEGQRRYVESLSAYARQFLQMMEKPDVESIDGLSPAISSPSSKREARATTTQPISASVSSISIETIDSSSTTKIRRPIRSGVDASMLVKPRAHAPRPAAIVKLRPQPHEVERRSNTSRQQSQNPVSHRRRDPAIILARQDAIRNRAGRAAPLSVRRFQPKATGTVAAAA